MGKESGVSSGNIELQWALGLAEHCKIRAFRHFEKAQPREWLIERRLESRCPGEK
jgi:hypothetical protein